MMHSVICILLALLLSLSTAAVAEEPEFIDYAAQLQLNMASETQKTEVTVKTFIDGDTTHFNVPVSVSETGVLKARYLAVNTPEVTGKIEEYGKKAAAFTRERLTNAVSILIESDAAAWEIDSTGERYLTWVWYKPKEGSEYRNLNLELLQNGLCIASATANNRYGAICSKALSQARTLKLNVYSGQKDPDFYYGDAVELTLKELRTNLEAYNGIKVAFNGVITMNDANSVYVESLDEETGLYYGMSVYYGYGLSGEGMRILSVGNEVRIVGTLQFYEAGGTWQVSGLSYRMMRPKDPGNIQKLSEGHSPSWVLTSPERFTSQVSILVDDTAKAFDYAALAMATSVEMKALTVKEVHTTTNEDSSSFGALTLICEGNGCTVHVRTLPFKDENGSLITADRYAGHTVDVKGIVDYFDGHYQIKVFFPDHILLYD